MKNPEANFESKKITSILERQEIIAPPNFVSVFHETKEEFLPVIDQEGLKLNSELKNIGKADAMIKRNVIIDKFRSNNLKAKGISRSNIYAYPFLALGHGLMGADERFRKRDAQLLQNNFNEFQKYNPGYLRTLAVGTSDDYVKKMTNSEYLKSQYPGEIVELKVDPKKCYVGDLEYITMIMDDINRGLTEEEATQKEAVEYWGNLITLEDFLKWYKKPEWAEDRNNIKDADDYKDGEPFGTSEFYPIKGAPDNFPWRIHQPEILIPENVPQNHIKLIK